MLPTKYLPLVAVLLLLSVFEASGDDVLPPPSPPLSGYPSYGAPPPPTTPFGYSIYSTPPPPVARESAGQSKCPPAGAGVQCCTPPASYTYEPPNPYTYAPPNPYTYVPYGGGENLAPRLLLPILAPLMMLLSSFIFLFWIWLLFFIHRQL